MKTKRYGTVLLSLALVSFSLARPAGGAEPRAVFEKLKTLAGKWKGTNADGQAGQVTYQVLSGGSAVVEILAPEGEETMITVYHMDGNDLRLTHYCSAQNQPRLKATSVSPEGRVVSFAFVDATNLPSTSAGHIHNLEITFIDNDRIQQKWTWLAQGRETHNVIQLTRVP